MKTCTVDGCGRPHHARGYCGSHYRMWRNGEPIKEIQPQRSPLTPAPPCTFAGCDRPAVAKELCHTHYTQQRLRGDLAPIRQPVVDVCAFNGCDRPGFVQQWCRTHYGQLRRGQELRPIRSYRKRGTEPTETPATVSVIPPGPLILRPTRPVLVIGTAAETSHAVR